ncbi:enoyl-CoA hydratase/isomerase family protein [Xanthobacter sp. VNH20]|uniref:enoyl-CoA hydratase/isomerase family protein n=1 Tax=Xanthobacteraceae TaxID=335928 RepID=UPI0032B3A970
MTAYSTLTFSVENDIARLVLNRPDQRNALDLDMRREIEAVLRTLREERNAKALVIAGSGGSFCAGGDLKSLSAGRRPAPVNRERIRRLHTWFDELLDLEMPVVAVVDGPAFGAGFNLALAADFILATPRAQFCAVFVRIGLVPDLGGLQLLPRIVGLQRAKELIFSGRVLGAEEAKGLGIVHDILPEGDALAAGIAFAERFRHAPTDAIGMAKTVLNQAFNLDRHALAELEAYAQAVALETPYHHEAVADFLARKPLGFVWERFQPKGDK